MGNKNPDSNDAPNFQLAAASLPRSSSCRSSSSSSSSTDAVLSQLMILSQPPSKEVSKLVVGSGDPRQPQQTTNKNHTVTDFVPQWAALRQPHVQAMDKCLQDYLQSGPQPSNGGAPRPPKAMTWFSLSQQLDDGYDILRTTWNQRNAARQYPDVVALPITATDAAAVVKCALQTRHRVCGRNGKASYEGDTCTAGVVVDVTQLQSVQRLGPNAVRLGAGLTVGRVAVELDKFGLMLPMSSGSAVGLTGLLLVGGHGMLARPFGLTADFVAALEIVTNQGQVITATADNEYADYLWMARGGGSGVQHFPGIITAVEVHHLPTYETTHPAQDHAYTHHQIWFPPTIDNAVQVLHDWQAFLVDPNVTLHPLYNRLSVEPWLFLYAHNYGNGQVKYQKQLYLSAYFFGNDTHHAQYEQELLPHVLKLGPDGKGQVRQAKRYAFLDFHRMLSGTKNFAQLASGQHGYDLHEQGDGLNHWKGYSIVSGTANVSDEAFRKLATHMYESQPLTRRYFEGKPLGGAMGRLGKSDTAFWHRDAVWWGLYNNFYHSKDEASRVQDILDVSRAFYQDFVQAMGADNFAGCYAGYIDHGLQPDSTPLEDKLRVYYGDNAPRLAEIKRQRDPDNLFAIHVPTREALESLVAAREFILPQLG
mmetsp:Transcript_2992/g.5754  ORF Transcript_2992/g.5754 Transcript_2992/m.5754 type:complete len:648 (-) Transcript_2992:32-1975(-)